MHGDSQTHASIHAWVSTDGHTPFKDFLPRTGPIASACSPGSEEASSWGSGMTGPSCTSLQERARCFHGSHKFGAEGFAPSPLFCHTPPGTVMFLLTTSEGKEPEPRSCYQHLD